MKTQCRFIVVPVSIILVVVIGAVGLDGWLHRVDSRPLPQPSLPARFFGTVTINGANVLTGTVLFAQIGKRVYATTVITMRNGISSYVIDIPGDDPGTSDSDGGRDGDELVFKIPGFIATQKGVWLFGGLINLNLTMIPEPKSPVSVPEPITIILFGTGVTALSAFAAISKRKQPR